MREKTRYQVTRSRVKSFDCFSPRESGNQDERLIHGGKAIVMRDIPDHFARIQNNLDTPPRPLWLASAKFSSNAFGSDTALKLATVGRQSVTQNLRPRDRIFRPRTRPESNVCTGYVPEMSIFFRHALTWLFMVLQGVKCLQRRIWSGSERYLIEDKEGSKMAKVRIPLSPPDIEDRPLTALVTLLVTTTLPHERLTARGTHGELLLYRRRAVQDEAELERRIGNCFERWMSPAR